MIELVSVLALAFFALGGYLVGIHEGRMIAEEDADYRALSARRHPASDLGRGHLRLVRTRHYDWADDRSAS